MGIMLLIFLGIVFLIILPTVNHIGELDKDTYEMRLDLEKKYEHNRNLRTVLKELEKAMEATSNYNNFIFKSGQELQLITQLENMANKNNVIYRVNNSNLDNITNQRLTLSLNISGTYNNTLNYLADLENFHYFININRLYLIPLQDRLNPNNTSTVSMDLDFSLYATP